MKARSSLYTAEVADRILRELRAGRSLHAICRDDGVPHRATIANWITQDREGFAERYRQARGIGHGSPGQVRYSAETADRFLGELMGGRTLVDVCGDPDMPNHSTINHWVANDREGFKARYRRAREIGYLTRAAIPYTAEIADQILDELMSGRALNEICSEPDMPSASSVRRWVRDDREAFTERYRQAREFGWHSIGDQMLQIVDDRRNDWIVRRREDGSTEIILDPDRVKRAGLRVKTRRWLLARMLPRTFGNLTNRAARQNIDSDYDRDLAEMMKLIDGRTRGLPSEDEPLDED